MFIKKAVIVESGLWDGYQVNERVSVGHEADHQHQGK